MLISTKHRHQSERLRIFLVCYFLLVMIADGKEIVVLGQPTDQERSWIGITQQLFDYIQYQKVIAGEQYECRTILKANFSSNRISKVYPLHTTLKTPRKQGQGELLVEERVNYEKSKLVKRVDKALDLLKGHCAYYQSDTFIYEYCHKQHMRQFDSQITKLINSKALFEDILMGVYNPQKRHAHSEHETTAKQQENLLPQYSDFTKQYRIFTAGFSHNEGIIQFQQSADGNLMYGSYNILQRNNYKLLQIPVFVQFTCLKGHQLEQIKNYGLLVDPFTFIYTARNQRCSILLDYVIKYIDARFVGGKEFQQLRVYGRYLFGKVQEKCSSPKFWSSLNGIKGDFDYEGRLMKITYISQTLQQQQTLVTIRKVHSSELFQFQEEIGTSIRYSEELSEVEGNPHLLKIAEIRSCQIMFQRPALSKQPRQIRLLRNRIIQSKELIQVGSYLGCVGSISIEQFTLSENQLQLFIVKQIWDNYYKVILSMKGRKLTQGEQILSEYIQNFTCYQLQQLKSHEFQDNIMKQQQQQSDAFMESHRLTPKKPLFPFPKDTESYFYVINIGEIGLLKLTTSSEKNVSFTYLISASKILKVRQGSGVNMEITQQNQYYENKTSSEGLIFSDYIYIRMGKLSNCSRIGGIWKTQDYAEFPRLILFDQTLISLQRVHGNADIKSIKLEKINHQHFATSKWLESLREHFDASQKYDDDGSFFLEQSYSLSYLYIDGDYCIDPISKHRFTNVTLKCGSSYLQIKRISQPHPCEYSIEIQTSILCKDGQTFAVQKEEELSTSVEIRKLLSAGVICFPSEDMIWKRRDFQQDLSEIQQNEGTQVLSD